MRSVSVTVAGAEAVAESEAVAAIADGTLGRRDDGVPGGALLAEGTEGLPPPAALVKVAAASPSPVLAAAPRSWPNPDKSSGRWLGRASSTNRRST